jgi:hypothetical protein
MADFQIILLPKQDYWQWVAAAKDYVIQFAANLTADPDTAGRFLAPQQVVTVVDAPNGYPAQGNIRQWFAQHYPNIQLDVVPAQSPDELQRSLTKRVQTGDRYLPVQPVFDFGPLWPPRQCLVGLHGRADGRMQPADFAVVSQARIEAVKLLSTAASEDIDRLRALNPQMFIMVRLFDSFKNRLISADDFASHVVDDMRRFYEKGVRYFEVHNEVNLRDEGWGSSWQTGRDFAAWFLNVCNNLKHAFPEAKFGWPGLSPDGFPMPERTNDMRFLDEAVDAVQAADFVCLHCYWRTEAEMLAPAGGMGWQDYRRRYPEKLLFITEFSNPTSNVTMTVKARQYVRYYEGLRSVPGLGAAFSFVASASASFPHEAWRGEDGRLSEMVTIVGGRSLA